MQLFPKSRPLRMLPLLALAACGSATPALWTPNFVPAEVVYATVQGQDQAGKPVSMTQFFFSDSTGACANIGQHSKDISTLQAVNLFIPTPPGAAPAPGTYVSTAIDENLQAALDAAGDAPANPGPIQSLALLDYIEAGAHLTFQVAGQASLTVMPSTTGVPGGPVQVRLDLHAMLKHETANIDVAAQATASYCAALEANAAQWLQGTLAGNTPQ